jgi:hypothetical protein
MELKNCLLCPRGTRCKGYILHGLVLKLYTALEAGQDAEAVARAISNEDMHMLAEYGAVARETCWSKGFVLAMAAKLAELGQQGLKDTELRNGIERLITRMDNLFARLPNGVSVDLTDLTIEVYNSACEAMSATGGGFLPASILGQAYAQLQRIKAGKGAA